MITVGNVKILMKCVHTFRSGRHKRQADITLLFQYTCIMYIFGKMELYLYMQTKIILKCIILMISRSKDIPMYLTLEIW